MATADQNETYACRVEGCNRTFGTKHGRGQHHSQTHDYEKLLKEDLQRIADELGRAPTLADIDSRDDCASASSYRNEFESWNETLKSIGVKPNHFTKSRAELKEDLQRIADELGRAPKMKDVNSSDDCASGGSYQKEFGSWNKALESVGLEINPVRKTRAELKEDLQRIADELGRAPTAKEMEYRDDCAATSTYELRFGSWNKALESVGVEPNQIQLRKSRAELKEDLQRVAEELGRSPTANEINSSDDCASTEAYRNEFGCWNNALKSVGLEINRRPGKTSRTELKEDLHRIADELSRTPKQKDVNSRNDCVSSDSYRNKFGSWNKALKSAGLEINQIQLKKSRAELKEDLQRIADELGRSPTAREIRSRNDCASSATYRREFGSWNESLETIGLSLNRDQSRRPDLPFAKSSTKWTKISQSIRQRDDHHCRCCGTTQEIIGRALSIHHITPRRKFKHIDIPDRFKFQNNPQNLISLCPSCHASVEGKFQGTDPKTFAHKAREYLGYTEDNDILQSLTSQAHTDASVAAD